MALQFANRVLETSTSTGTGDFTLAGAVTGYQAFSAACSTSDTIYYAIYAVDAGGTPTGEWEAGLGTYSAANTLTRTTVEESSNSGSAVSFGAGTKYVLASPTAAFLDTLQGTATSDLTAASTLDGTELVHVVQGGNSRKTTAQEIAALSGAATDPVNRIVSGGGVIWESAYTFRVAAASYYINGTLYESAEQTITLDAADATNPRIDVLVLDDTGTLGKITGTPLATPNEPDIDPTTQIKVTFVLVDAASTAPSVTSTAIYAENTEWTSSTSGTGFNAASTTNPNTGTVCIEGTDVATDAYVQLVAGSTTTFGGDDVLALFIRSKAAWGKNRALRLAWFNGAVAVGSPVTLADGYWGFDSSITDSYQLVAIPMSNFGTAAGQVLDTLRATCARGTMGFYLDDIEVQATEDVGTPSGNYLTKEDADARYALKGSPPLAFNFSADGETRFYADTAMTLTEQDTSGTATVAYEKSTAAAPDTFASTSSPISLEAGAWLKVSASSVSTIFAVALKRTA